MAMNEYLFWRLWSWLHFTVLRWGWCCKRWGRRHFYFASLLINLPALFIGTTWSRIKHLQIKVSCRVAGPRLGIITEWAAAAFTVEFVEFGCDAGGGLVLVTPSCIFLVLLHQCWVLLHLLFLVNLWFFDIGMCDCFLLAANIFIHTIILTLKLLVRWCNHKELILNRISNVTVSLTRHAHLTFTRDKKNAILKVSTNLNWRKRILIPSIMHGFSFDFITSL